MASSPTGILTRPDGTPDSVRLKRDTRNTSSSFSTPIKIGGFSWTNSFSLREQEIDAPATIILRDPNDSSIRIPRVFAKTFSTELDWQTGISLPAFLQGSFKISPSINFQNVDGHAFWVRTEQSGGRYVHQTQASGCRAERFAHTVRAVPRFRSRHVGSGIRSRRSSLTTTPRLAKVSDEFLRALNMTKQGYLGDLAQNRLTLGLSHAT